MNGYKLSVIGSTTANDREFPNTIRALLQNFALFKKWNRPYPSAMFAVVERAARNS